MASYQKVEINRPDHYQPGREDERWLRSSSPSSATSSSSDSLSSLDSCSSHPSGIRHHKPQAPSQVPLSLPSPWRLPWPFSQKQKDEKAQKEEGHEKVGHVAVDTTYDLVFHRHGHRENRLPPPLNIPLIPTNNTPTASPLSPSWWATTGSTVASPSVDSLSSVTSQSCLCSQYTIEKEGCLCSGGVSKARIHSRPSTPFSPSVSNETATNNKHSFHATAPAEKNPLYRRESSSGSSDMEPGFGWRRRSSAGEVLQQQSPKEQRGHPSSHQQGCLPSTSAERYSKHRRLLQQKQQYNQYLLGHSDWLDFHLAPVMFIRDHSDSSDEQGGVWRLKRKSKGFSINGKSRRALQGGRRGGEGGAGGGARGTVNSRRQRWRSVQRWSIVISLVVVLVIGAALVLRIAVYRQQQSRQQHSSSDPSLSSELRDETERAVNYQHMYLQPLQRQGQQQQQPKQMPGEDEMGASHQYTDQIARRAGKAPPALPKLRQEEVYAQDPQQERIDRLLFRGGGDRWIVSWPTSSLRRGGERLTIYQQPYTQITAPAPPSLQQESQQQQRSAFDPPLGLDVRQQRGQPRQQQQQPDAGNILDYYPDEEDEDAI